MNVPRAILLLIGFGLLAACNRAPAVTPVPPTSTSTRAPTEILPTSTVTVTPSRFEKVLDIPYSPEKGVNPILQSLDVYSPSGQSSRPVLVMIHGGDWYEGDKANPGVAFTKAKFFVSQGWVLVSINYRLAPQAQHPLPVQDVATALAWVSDNISRYGGDPAEICIMGHASGAHLAALVATDERYLKKVGKDLNLIKRVVLLDGSGYDIPQAIKNKDGLLEIYKAAFNIDPKTWKDASPVTHIASGKGIPPFLIFYAGAKPAAFELSGEMFDALQVAGVQVSVAGIPDKNHNSLSADIGTPGDWVTQQILKFLSPLGTP